jgi:hypothetical protein
VPNSLTYDVVIATDCRLPAGNAASVADEIKAQAQAGYHTGLIHLPSPQVTRSAPFAPALRQVVDAGVADLVHGVEKIETRLLTVRHPAVLTDPPDELPNFDAEHVVLCANQAPAGIQRKSRNFDVDHVHSTAERVLGRTPVWAPVGPRIRQALSAYADRIPIRPDDWEPVLDLAGWQVDRTGFVADRAVIGRHAAEHWGKWPRHRIDLLEAYPDDPRYAVQVLGSLETPRQVLGRIPPNWTSVPFGSTSPPEFLAGIDFFVYFHHQKLIEPFGRAVLEALASGAVVIVPRYLEQVFGDACRYGHPADVRRHIDQLYADWEVYAAQSRAGVELVRQRFSLHRHASRVTELIGPPSATPREAPPPAPPARPRGTLVVDLTRGRRLDPMVSSIVRATVAERGPRLIALPAARAAELGNRIAAETFPRVVDDLSAGERRAYLRMRLPGLLRAHRPARVMIVDDGHLPVRELATGFIDYDAAIWHIQPAGVSAPESDQLVQQIAALLPTGWSISRLTAPADAAPEPAPPQPPDLPSRAGLAISRWWRDVGARVRRWLLGRLTGDLRAAGLGLVEVGDTPVTLPAGPDRPGSDAVPVALVVVTDTYADPEPSIQAIAERQLVAGTFRAAVLAPPDWEPAAAVAGLTVETLLPETTWSGMYGSGWPEYVRQRVDEACRALAPSTIAHAGGSLARAEELRVVLDVLESARVRRVVGGDG